jgi:exonuclease SbcC
MMTQLSAISVTDFRSLRGTVNIPLDAPVVLIHGPNGAGKTSVLSALELALTGEVLAMRRTDPGYRAHLQNRDADHGRIVLTGAGLGHPDAQDHEITLRNGIVTGTPALIGNESQFFSERCYLAQATLGRLLEIYQDASVRQDSPLTRFVKDLLGLDHLDALIDGLSPVGDVRNLRRLVPKYGEAETDRSSIEGRIAESRTGLTRLAEEATGLRSSIRAKLAAFAPEVSLERDDEFSDTLDRLLRQDTEEIQLVALAGHRRDLASLKQRGSVVLTQENTVDQDSAVAEELAASEALRIWRSDAGEVLEALIDELRGIFPDLPSIASTDPETALRTALSRVIADLERCARTIAQDDVLANEIEALDQSVAHGRARMVLVDEQLSQIAGDTESLSRVLAALLPHIHDESCPVCGRDYREVSRDPLAQRLSLHVARLTEQADLLQSLGRTRVQSINDLTKSELDRDAAVSKRLSQETRGALKARVAELTEAQRRLKELAPLAETGATVIRRDVQARRRLTELRDRDRMSFELRTAIGELCLELKQTPLETTESIADAIQRLDAFVAERARVLSLRQSMRRDASAENERLREIATKAQEITETFARDTKLHTQLEVAFQIADGHRQAAKAVARAAAEARTAIVGRVFNSALNRIWRDLFVRLAPTEPFVPAFRLPRTIDEPVTAQLETVHRDGGTGGAPGAMLSAGNLNTAALTLFLALHLAAKPRLPWLVLDDPVQSMDEVHIAQLAALLRTLSKEHGRKIVMAIHDRQLFDYLSLELSPAFAGDRLITVEVTRSGNGTSLVEPTYKNWVPDNAVAA